MTRIIVIIIIMQLLLKLYYEGEGTVSPLSSYFVPRLYSKHAPRNFVLEHPLFLFIP